MSHILFLSLVGPPDGVSTARLVGGLAGGLKARGHAVTILTTSPHYNRDIAAEKLQPIAWKRGGLIGRSSYEGVDVIHVAMPRKGRSAMLRILAWVWFHVVSTLVGLLALPRFDIIIAPSPPLTIGVSAWMLSRLRRAPFLYNVQELYPDIAIELGFLRNRFIIWALLKLERLVYAKAEGVIAISPGISRVLRGKGVPDERLAEIQNFVDPLDMSNAGAPNEFSETHSLSGAFVVTYAGNIGTPQGLELIVEGAWSLREESGFKFVIVGDGSAKAEIANLVRSRGLANVLMLPYQPYESMPQIYAASSVCLVLQSSGIGASSLPSKVVEIAGVGRPIVAVTDSTSDLADLVRKTQSGRIVEPGRVSGMVEALREMRDNKAHWEGRALAARGMVFEAFSKRAIVEKYDALVCRVFENGRDRVGGSRSRGKVHVD